MAVSSRRTNSSAGAIVSGLAISQRLIEALHPNPKNPRKHSASQIKQIANSIASFGFVVPIVCDSSGNIVAGHGRWLAAKRLELPQVPVIEIDHLSSAQLKALGLADNKLSDNSSWDDILLGELFKELSGFDLEFDLGTTGFSPTDIDLLIDGLADTKADPVDAVATSGPPVMPAVI